MNDRRVTRREVLKWTAGAVGAMSVGLPSLRDLCAQTSAAATAPALPVAIARCPDYELQRVGQSLATSFDQIGGIGSLVRGKTVTVKANLTGDDPGGKCLGLPPALTYQSHHSVCLATVHLLAQNGAKRIRFVESAYRDMPMEAYCALNGWDISQFRSAGNVEWKDTHGLGKHKAYVRLQVPWGGYLFPAFDVNPAYAETDVYVSIAKLKNHAHAGVTLAIKNNFGIVPTTIYGSDAQEKGEKALASRVLVLHRGSRPPAMEAPAELDPQSPRDPNWRVPRVTVDIVGIRPVDLAIIDGIESVSGGEGPWIRGLKRTTPGVLIVGRNAVCTDAVAAAVMGYDPQAPARTKPFPGDNHLQLAADAGIGSNDLKRIEVLNASINEVLYPYST